MHAGKLFFFLFVSSLVQIVPYACYPCLVLAADLPFPPSLLLLSCRRSLETMHRVVAEVAGMVKSLQARRRQMNDKMTSLLEERR